MHLFLSSPVTTTSENKAYLAWLAKESSTSHGLAPGKLMQGGHPHLSSEWIYLQNINSEEPGTKKHKPPHTHL